MSISNEQTQSDDYLWTFRMLPKKYTHEIVMAELKAPNKNEYDTTLELNTETTRSLQLVARSF